MINLDDYIARPHPTLSGWFVVEAHKVMDLETRLLLLGLPMNGSTDTNFRFGVLAPLQEAKKTQWNYCEVPVGRRRKVFYIRPNHKHNKAFVNPRIFNEYYGRTK